VKKQLPHRLQGRRFNGNVSIDVRSVVFSQSGIEQSRVFGVKLETLCSQDGTEGNHFVVVLFSIVVVVETFLFSATSCN
jgi:diphthamide biosynthesis methyltransferase